MQTQPSGRRVAVKRKADYQPASGRMSENHRRLPMNHDPNGAIEPN